MGDENAPAECSHCRSWGGAGDLDERTTGPDGLLHYPTCSQPLVDRGPDDHEDEGQEMVNHPSHYGGADNPFEVIKVTDAWLTREENTGAMKFTIIRYIARAGKKDPSKTVEDLRKAAFYLNHLIERLKDND